MTRPALARRAVMLTLTFADVVPSISLYRAARKGSVYTFTNAVGDSLRYRAVGSR